MNIIQEASDKEMELEGGRYKLTVPFIKNSVDGAENARDDKAIERRSSKNSRLIYGWIRSHCHSANWKTVLFILNRTEEGKRLLKEALISQLEADLMSGYNDLGKMPTDQQTKREDIYLGQLTVETEQILSSSVAELGVNILSMAPFPQCYIEAIRRCL